MGYPECNDCNDDAVRLGLVLILFCVLVRTYVRKSACAVSTQLLRGTYVDECTVYGTYTRHVLYVSCRYL
jgi:hypothetical protein